MKKHILLTAGALAAALSVASAPAVSQAAETSTAKTVEKKITDTATAVKDAVKDAGKSVVEGAEKLADKIAGKKTDAKDKADAAKGEVKDAAKKTDAKADEAKKAVVKKADAAKGEVKDAAKKVDAKADEAKKAVAKKADEAKKAVAKKADEAKKAVAKKADEAKKAVAKKADAKADDAKKTVAKGAVAAGAAAGAAAKVADAKKADANKGEHKHDHKKAGAKKADAKKAVAAASAASQKVDAGIAGTPFEVALLGDLPYIPANMGRFKALKKQIDESSVKFAIHDGDFKSGGSLCSDEMFKERFALLNSFKKPLLYIPGDNEWTDCHRKSNGSYDPLERLAMLRKVFFMDAGSSLGQEKLSVVRQGEVDGTAYPENFRISLNRVHFVGLHVIGSNNNLGRTPAGDEEYLKRNKATIAWLKQSYQLAKLHHDKAMVIVIHANPKFEEPAEKRTGFNEFIAALEAEAGEFKIPTLFVHGDSHQYQVNKPLPLVPGKKGNKHPKWPHFTRLETFGSPNVHWVKLKIDISKKWPFSYEEMLVEEAPAKKPLSE